MNKHGTAPRKRQMSRSDNNVDGTVECVC
jgi:hypothetical protein